MNSRTHTSVNAHSIKKGDVVYRGATPLLVYRHPLLAGGKVFLDMVFMENGHRHTEELPKNTPIKLVVGAHVGGGMQ